MGFSRLQEFYHIWLSTNNSVPEQYAKSIWDNAIMISFVPGKPKVVTGNSSKNLEPMSLCWRNVKHTMWMENDKEPICHVSNI
jgi:hypothetical protein